ncbi:ATP-dependent zinc protease [Photobacterium sp.]|uniref:ATP-dependent zinc protease family protein n=1 Tax=Photobacterium sp. TaxID=660 RepID=UPI00299D98F3|nr:ATP-dependent zinc protease [Photobacterium sp.]MDX1304635.1 ATP-dependent zinc protease [Photobacterium sp.]
MLRRSIPLLTFAILSGCTLAPSHDQEKTLHAITAMETNVNGQLTAMSEQINEQNEYIANLEKELSSIAEDLNREKTSADTRSQVMVETNIIPPSVIKPVADPKVAHGKAILGEEEWVWLDSVQSRFKARIDSGATTSSLNALDIQIFERDGKEWVRFNLNHNSEVYEPKPEIVEAPVLRWVKIRQSTSENASRRPVIEAWVNLGPLHEKTQFTLADRSQMVYPVLLGREFFKDIALVDVGKQYVQGQSVHKPNIQ